MKRILLFENGGIFIRNLATLQHNLLTVAVNSDSGWISRLQCCVL